MGVKLRIPKTNPMSPPCSFVGILDYARKNDAVAYLL